MRSGPDSNAPKDRLDSPFQEHDDMNLPDPYADEPKWPAWKVTLFVVVFCGAFWSGVAYIVTRLVS